MAGPKGRRTEAIGGCASADAARREREDAAISIFSPTAGAPAESERAQERGGKCFYHYGLLPFLSLPQVKCSCHEALSSPYLFPLLCPAGNLPLSGMRAKVFLVLIPPGKGRGDIRHRQTKCGKNHRHCDLLQRKFRACTTLAWFKSGSLSPHNSSSMAQSFLVLQLCKKEIERSGLTAFFFLCSPPSDPHMSC